MPIVRVFKTTRCPYCTMAIRFLQEVKKVSVQIEDLTGDMEARRALMEETGQRTVPQIFIGDTHVGGYDELRALDRRGELDPLLNRE